MFSVITIMKKDTMLMIVKNQEFMMKSILENKCCLSRKQPQRQKNDFMLDNSYGDETLQELTAAVSMMARIQPADDNVDSEPSYDAKAVTETYAYADVRSQNQDLLTTISEVKNKIKTIEKLKNVNTKFDKSQTSRTLLFVTPLPKNIAAKAKKVSNTKVNADRSKLVTSHSIPKNEQSQKQSANVIAKGMYRITKTKTQTPDFKTNINVSNSTGVESPNSVSRPKSKDTKSKDRVLKNTNDKRPSAHVRKMSSSVSIDSNKHETMNSTVIKLVFWIVDSGCSMHMTSNLQLIRNFIKKFIGTVRFRNDHFAAITVYGDYVQGNLKICHVYYVEGLGHNLFSIGQICDGDLEVTFRSNTCCVWNLKGDDLLTGSRLHQQNHGYGT
nr:integrase, catalytic region, zinc finger, CCHC-type, peptidase aspartic, catalytic [Tanacetum cinerariifolium]